MFPCRVLWAIGVKAGGGESATSKQAIRLDLAIAGGSWRGEEKGGSGQCFPQEQRGQTLLGSETRSAGGGTCTNRTQCLRRCVQLCVCSLRTPRDGQLNLASSCLSRRDHCREKLGGCDVKQQLLMHLGAPPCRTFSLCWRAAYHGVRAGPHPRRPYLVPDLSAAHLRSPHAPSGF